MRDVTVTVPTYFPVSTDTNEPLSTIAAVVQAPRDIDDSSLPTHFPVSTDTKVIHFEEMPL